MKHISVLNYNDNCVCINIAPGKTIKIDAATYGEPTMVPLTLDEIKFANNGRAFKTGLLEFSSDIEDELYEELRINKDKVLKLSEVRDILIHPSKDGLIKILSISSLSDFDRIRGQFQKLKYEGYKLTLDIADIIDRRTKELFNNQVKSDIKIGDADVVYNADSRKILELEKQIEEMKAMVESIVPSENKDTETEEVISSDEKEPKISTAKRPGRPKKISN